MKNITCQNILNILPLYVEGKTTVEQSEEISNHLNNCEKCREKYIYLKEISEKIKTAFDKIDKKQFEDDYVFFRENMSAFIDNELPKEDYYRFNAYVASHPDAKKELEEMMYFIEQLQNIFNEQDFLKTDLSDKTVNEIKEENPDYFSALFIKAAVITFIFILITILAGYLSVLDKFPDVSDIKNKIFTSLPVNSHSRAK